MENIDSDFNKDSGMESGIASSKDDTPERKTELVAADDLDDYEDEPDETLLERLYGLTEMFPDPVRNVTGSLVNFTSSSIVTLYNLSCSASWILFTSSMVLFAPIIFETERANMEEMQKSQQKQVLLGTPGPGAPGAMPPIPR